MSELFTLHEGDCRAGLLALPAGHLHCVVTSIPYYGLRTYGTAPQVWGGDPACDHQWGSPERAPWANSVPGPNTGGKNTARTTAKEAGAYCSLCAAWRGELGSEPTPDLFVAHIVEVFRAVRHALRADGSVWLNIGDTYSGQGHGSASDAGRTQHSPKQNAPAYHYAEQSNRTRSVGVPAKNLLLIPARIALALQADGWIVRAEIIWHKPNPMPESVSDRPTKAHEQIYLLTLNPTYFYDADAIRETSTGQAGSAANFQRSASKYADSPVPGQAHGQHREDREPTEDTGTRNARSVWTVASEPYPEAHFATFPTELPRRCILAGTSAKGCCSACGAPWRRCTMRTFVPMKDRSPEVVPRGAGTQKPMDSSNGWQGFPRGTTETQTTGWEPTCACNASVVPCRVGDPFMGSGTTAEIAIELGCEAWGAELQTAYVPLIHARVAPKVAARRGDRIPIKPTADLGPLFALVTEVAV